MTYYEVILSLFKKDDGNARFNLNLSEVKNNGRKSLPKGTECKTENFQVYTRYFHEQHEAQEYINLIEQGMNEISPQVFAQ